jgi:large subunit ribosomal protein L4
MAMAGKIQDSQVWVLNDLSLDQPRTSEVAAMLKAMNLGGTTTLIATDGNSSNVYKSARNIPGVTVSHVSDLNALIILQPQQVLITRSALDAMKEGRSAEPVVA